MKKRKPFKSEYERRLLQSIARIKTNFVLVPLTTIFIAGCSSIPFVKDELLEPWPPHTPRLQHLQSCRMKGSVRATVDGNKLSSDFVFRYRRNLEKSELAGLFYGPFQQALGKLQISSTERLWTDEKGQHDLRHVPPIQIWFSRQWWRDFDFLLGIISNRNESGVFKDQMGFPRKFISSNDRIFKCSFKNGHNEHPATCWVEDRQNSAKIDFTSVICEEDLR